MVGPQRRTSEVLIGFLVPWAMGGIVAACSDALRDEHPDEVTGSLAGGTAMLPSFDVAMVNVKATDTSAFFKNVDDGASFTLADNDTTVVRNAWDSSSASYTVGYSGGPSGTVSAVDVNYRVHATSGAIGTVQIKLLSGTTVVASGPVRSVGTAYTNFSEKFSGLSVASAQSLRTQINFARSNTVGYLKLTQIWLEAAGGASSDGGTSADSGGTTIDSGGGTVGGGTGSADEIHFTYLSPTAVTFDWRGSATTLRYGTTTSYSASANGVTPIPLPYSSSGPFHEARISGLLANTIYHYAIGAGTDHTFRTPPALGSSGFRVMVEGDIGDAKTYANVGIVQQQIADKKPAFVLAVGDLTYGNAHGQAVVDQHFNDVMVWSREAAYMPAWGNHEWDASTDDLRNYKGRFELPNARASTGAPSLGGPGEDWYWFDYGNVRFVAFPEPYTSATWTEWETAAGAVMAEAQANASIDFIITMGHRPAYSSGHHSGATGLSAIMGRLASKYSKYVLDLAGHSHDYERTTPQSGVVHITAGGGGSSLEQDGTCLWMICPAPSWSAFRAMRQGPVMLDISHMQIVGTAICGPAGGGTNDVDCVPGTAMDSFTLVPR